jgi:chemotaxis protein histidine kinase CheA
MSRWSASSDFKDLSESHYPKSVLKERQWTAAMIKKFLGDPDVKADNPVYLCAAAVCFYEKSRVHRLEKSKAFKAEIQRSQSRRAAAKKAVATKQAKTDKLVDDSISSIRVGVRSLDEVCKLAIESYNLRGGGSDFVAASWSNNDPFLERICVNFLRHEMSTYEYSLQRTLGKVGGKDAYLAIKFAVLEAIAESYPELRNECSRQTVDALERDALTFDGG